jgi:chemotaxis protein MotB
MPSPPPIIIKKKITHGGHHCGAWPTGSARMVGSDMQGSGENFIVNKDNMKELKEQLQKAIREVPKFNELQNHIDMTVTNEGLRIELTESANGVFFESGKDKLSDVGSDLVKLLAQELGKVPNSIAIEGHTDSKPYPEGALYTNGIRPDQITQVRGFADQHLRKPGAPLDPANRRISLIVQYLEKKPRDASSPENKGESGTANSKEGDDAAPKKEPGATPSAAPEKR